jgi:hypothetical protein
MTNCKIEKILRFFPYSCEKFYNCPYFVKPNIAQHLKGKECAYQINATLKQFKQQEKINKDSTGTPFTSGSLYQWRNKKRKFSKLYNWRIKKKK